MNTHLSEESRTAAALLLLRRDVRVLLLCGRVRLGRLAGRGVRRSRGAGARTAR